MNLPFPGERRIVDQLALSQLLPIEGSAVDDAAELVERERIRIAVLLQLQLGRADHFFHEPQRSADTRNFQRETLFERREAVFLQGGRAPRIVQIDPCQPLKLQRLCV